MFKYNNISKMLTDYEELEKKLLQLQFELRQSDSLVSDEDVIESMTFSSGISERVSGGQASDKTGSIAVSYADRRNSLTIKSRNELMREVEAINTDLERLKYYINLLDEKTALVLNALYIEGVSYSYIFENLGVPPTTAQRLMKKGIEKLTDMYNAIAK